MALASVAPAAPPAVRRPNIIFILADDHGRQAISAYGSYRNQTPNIDRLAKEGMLFRHSLVTNSICGPSRAVILTGKHSHLNGFLDQDRTFDGSQQTFPKLLQKAGYETAIVGKWHLASDPTGFDYWNVLIRQGTYYNPQMKTAAGVKDHTGYVTDIITDDALHWLKEGRDTSKPFMLMYQHKAPHREWEPGPDHLTLYDDVTIPEPPTLFDDYSRRASPARNQEMTIEKDLNELDLKLVAPENLTPDQKARWEAANGPKNAEFREAGLQGRDLVRWKYQRFAKDYLRSVASVDDNLGRVLAYLDQTGLAKNTVVIYSSDQGWFLGEHGWFDKRWMYEESLTMPLIVRWPGVVKPGTENRDLVSNLDFAETFLDMAGVPVPKDMQGRSLVPLLQGHSPADWRKSFYYHYYEFPGVHRVARHYGVRTDRYKLIYYYHAGEWELFDLLEDPDELRSVYDDPGYKDVVADLKKALDRLRLLYKVPDDPAVPQEKAGLARPRLPNIVIILTDDQGYADVGVFGAKGFRTPNLDRMAQEGRRFTNFHVAQPVCSASRAALLTGSYPNRIGIQGALDPSARHGINRSEMTLAELVKQRGYATAIFGKWHLGHHPEFLPTRHGFDEYFGLPYSNDMLPDHPPEKLGDYPLLPLLEGEKVVQLMPDQAKLTTWYTERAVRFIEKSKDRPFLLYVAHSMPHVPLYVSDKFKGKSQQGLYGDVIMEIDWSVGEILAALKERGLDEQTLVVFTSDNGPWLAWGDQAGSAYPLREGKKTAWEGGTRVPCIMRWPGRIPAGSVSREPMMTIDLFPTIARLTGAQLPKHKIDGLDVWPMIAGDPNAKNPHEAYYSYYEPNELQAVTSGRWKLILPHMYLSFAGQPSGPEGRPGRNRNVETELYDLETDVSETTDVAAKHPDVMQRLEALAEKARKDLGDSLTNRVGKGVREPGRVAEVK